MQSPLLQGKHNFEPIGIYLPSSFSSYSLMLLPNKTEMLSRQSTCSGCKSQTHMMCDLTPYTLALSLDYWSCKRWTTIRTRMYLFILGFITSNIVIYSSMYKIARSMIMAFLIPKTIVNKMALIAFWRQPLIYNFFVKEYIHFFLVKGFPSFTLKNIYISTTTYCVVRMLLSSNSQAHILGPLLDLRLFYIVVDCWS